MSISEQTRDVLGDALGVAPSEVTDGTALGMTAQWDSLAHMRLILALEERLGRQLGPDDIVSISQACDVEALLHPQG